MSHKRLLAKTDAIATQIEELNERDVVNVPPSIVAAILEVQGEVGVLEPRAPRTCIEAHALLMELQVDLVDEVKTRESSLCQKRDVLSKQLRICIRMAGHDGDCLWAPDTSDAMAEHERKRQRWAYGSGPGTLAGDDDL